MTATEPGRNALLPAGVTSEEQFVVALKGLRERSGLTFKEIERATSAEGGLVLPASTLATALQRRTAPRREMVAALVRVCGGSPGDVAEWLALRERLVHAVKDTPDEVEQPGEPAVEDDARTRRAPGGRVAGAVAVVLFLCGAAGAAGLRWSSGETGGTPHATGAAPVPAAPARVRPDGDLLKIGGFCLSEHEGDQTGRIYLADCAHSFPPRRLTPYGDLWRVATEHPRFGAGCMGVVDGSAAPGTALSDDTCGRIQTDRFVLRAAPGGYRLLPENDDLCVGVKGTPRAAAPVLQLPCDQRAPGQSITVTRRP
ncbi:XRE family transcriptional regulator [Actinomadura macrotermitis]|uniref:XRE family transcriptional regulator n=1 Tax=Actinomadura macrotermitis TaxID=2585200 RepID=A0A7K0BX47_9ACTN|nr:XRE family transcriptional regulator [Actinomadura macrotermitis]MQY05755.1 hypothetical protein [Actinomadura macrotermitis]